MNEPLISVVIPAYNIEQYIERTLDSVVGQTFSNLEIIVVNDGSQDNTANVLDRYAKMDSRIKIIHKENGGVTKARLTGVAAASGEWIGFIDGDDEIEPDMYEILIANAIKYGADISHCGYQMEFPSRVDFYYGTGRLVEQDNMAGLKDLIEGKFVEPGLWNKLFHKTLFHSLLQDELMDLSIKINEDLLMNFYLFREAKKSVFYDVCKYHYIVRAGSAANASLNINKLLDPIRVTRTLQKETVNIPQLNNALLAKLTRQLVSLATMPVKSDRALISPHRKNARRELRKMLPKVYRAKEIGLIFKFKATWAGLLPGSYGLIHSIYLKTSGLDKKYEIC